MNLAPPVAAALSPAPMMRLAAPMEPDKELARAHVKQAEELFARLGVTPQEGGGPIELRWDPKLADNAFQEGNSITFGRSSESGRWYSDSLDTVVHEYAHRVVSTLAPPNAERFNRYNEGDALHESFADVFATTVDSDDWTLGEGIDSKPFFSMEDPGSAETSAGHQAQHVNERRPNDDPQVLAGIPNHAAYRYGEAVGRDTMAQVYLHALKTMGGVFTFTAAAEAVVDSAAELFGADDRRTQAARDAWKGVGLLAPTAEGARRL